MLEERKTTCSTFAFRVGSGESPPPTVPTDYAQELVQLRACLEGLQREREDLRAELSRRGERRSRGRSRSFHLPISSLEYKRGSVDRGRLSSVMETLIDNAESLGVKPRVQPDVNPWCRKLSARYGLRAHRVGEVLTRGPRTQNHNDRGHFGPAHRVRRVPEVM